MAPCCIIIAIIFAQIAAALRRWGVFWGVLQPDEFDNPDTMVQRVRAFVARPAFRTVATGLLAVEIATFGWWISTYHGAHLYYIADQTVARISGQTVIDAPICDGSGHHQFRRITVARSALALKE